MAAIEAIGGKLIVMASRALARVATSPADYERVYDRVIRYGMGIVVLHSGHFSKIFRKLMGTTCNLKWRADGERETLWVTRPGHPIVADLGEFFSLEREEMYGEFFDIPEPECTFLISSFAGGEVFRSGCTWTRGAVPRWGNS